jgi:putative protein-disulfide isomerase
VGAGLAGDGVSRLTHKAGASHQIAGNASSHRVWVFLKLIQQAFYQRAEDVTRAPLLVELAEQAGYDRSLFATAFGSNDIRTKTAADFTWAQDLGIAGFPTLLAERNGQLALLTNGYQPLEALEPLLGRWLERAAYA